MTARRPLVHQGARRGALPGLCPGQEVCLSRANTRKRRRVRRLLAASSRPAVPRAQPAPSVWAAGHRLRAFWVFGVTASPWQIARYNYICICNSCFTVVLAVSSSVASGALSLLHLAFSLRGWVFSWAPDCRKRSGACNYTGVNCCVCRAPSSAGRLQDESSGSHSPGG